jgi:TonB family protein
MCQAQKVSYLKMGRTPCFGRCPTYEVELFKNGTIVYHGKKNVDRIGNWEAKIESKKMIAFLKSLDKYKLANLKNNYKPLSTDLPHIVYDFQINKNTKHVTNAEAGPTYLQDLGVKIDALIANANWIKEEEQGTSEGVADPIAVESNTRQIPADDNADQVYTLVEEMPEYPGGAAAMMDYIKRNTNFPEEAKAAGIQGKVVANFVIDEEGKIIEVNIVRSLGYGCDEESLRLINSMPNWTAGKQKDKPVKVRMVVPINFYKK